MASTKSLLKSFDPYDWAALRPLPVIGVDEAGRGCLAGRVYAGAVVFKSNKDVSLYTDSKLLSESRRNELLESIQKHHHWAVGFAEAFEIDQVNILNASHLAMLRAIDGLGLKVGHVLVDGSQRIRGLFKFVQTTLVKGDLRAAPVGAASIVAKVLRDRYITELGERFPQYGFATHKGYPTEAHRAAIQRFGPSPFHRKTFTGVREFLAPERVEVRTVR